jgi:hypothetical protein
VVSIALSLSVSGYLMNSSLLPSPLSYPSRWCGAVTLSAGTAGSASTSCGARGTSGQGSGALATTQVSLVGTGLDSTITSCCPIRTERRSCCVIKVGGGV